LVCRPIKPILRLLIAALGATSTFAFQFDITPFLNCVTVDPATAQTTAFFGYESHEQSVISIPVGTDNRIIPDPTNRNQPTLFVPGYFEKAFRVTFPSGTNVLLSFNGFAIPASSNSVPCAPTAGSPLPLSLPPAMTLVIRSNSRRQAEWPRFRGR
jgi:hypothetical protein